MRLLTLGLSLLVLTLVVFAPVQDVDSAEVRGNVVIEGMGVFLDYCGSAPTATSNVYSFHVTLNNAIFTNPDWLGPDNLPIFDPEDAMDWISVIVYDAYGNPLAGTSYGLFVGQGTDPLRIDPYSDGPLGPPTSGLVNAQARPFIAKVYDVDDSLFDINNVWDIIAFPELAVSEPYDPVIDSEACASLPIGDPYNFIVGVPSVADITSETGISSSASNLAVYTSDSGDGLDLYGINAESDGFYLGTITQEMIAPYAETPPEENTLIESFGADVNVYVLSTGEIQINVGPNEEGKTFVYVFDGIPWTSITTYVIDPPLSE